MKNRAIKRFRVLLYHVKIHLSHTYFKIVFFFRGGRLILRKESTDLEVFKEIFVKNELALTLDFTPNLIIDCGAYVGFSSLSFFRRFPTSVIVAVEPEINNYRSLVRNRGSICNIKTLNAAVWNRNSRVQMFSGIGEWGFSTRESIDFDDGAVPAVTIDDILKSSGFDIIDILKIDIEGAELKVFDESCHTWLSKVRVLIIELHERIFPGSSGPFMKAISSYNWRFEKSGEKLVLYRQ